MRRIRKRTPVDRYAAKELWLYTENDSDIYRQRLLPIQKNLTRKRQKGIYQRKLAIRAFQYATDDAAKKYNKEFGSGQGFGIFSPIERKYAAAKMVMSFETEYDLGNYDHLKIKRLRRKR